MRLNTFAQPFKRLVHASFTFRARENESPKLHPTIRDKRNFRKADKRSEMIAARNPWVVLVHDRIFSRLCKREFVLVPTTLLSGSKFISLNSCVVNYNTSLSQDHSACFWLYNERRASVLFGHQDGILKTFSRASFRSFVIDDRETVKQVISNEYDNFNIPWKNSFLVPLDLIKKIFTNVITKVWIFSLYLSRVK